MRVSSLVFLFLILFASSQAYSDERIKIGVPTALSGDAATFGVDIRNALELANDKLGRGRYELIFEDERCSNREAVSVAQKFINLHKVKYALGFPCNQTLLATADLYNRANILVITASATSGDVTGLGRSIFRLFPSDVLGADLLYSHISIKTKRLLIVTEQSEFPVLMDRSIRRFNSLSRTPIEISSIEFSHGDGDLKTQLLSAIQKGVDGVFINTNTDASFIPVTKQLSDIKYHGARYAIYLPSSSSVLQALGGAVNGIEFANLPLNDQLVTESGAVLLKEFKTRYGEPQSGFPVVPMALESFRLLDLALNSKVDPIEFLKKGNFQDGFIPTYHFDEDGAVAGIGFQMQRIDAGKVVVIK